MSTYNPPPPILPRLPIMTSRSPVPPTMRPAMPLPQAATRWLYDLHGNGFEFGLVIWSDPPHVTQATYAFMNAAGQVGYIGKALDLRDRQSRHERKAEAVRKGYHLLYVHVPSIFARFRFDQVEEALIKALRPPMNEKFTSVAALFG